MGRQVMMGSILDNYVKVIFDVENSLKLNQKNFIYSKRHKTNIEFNNFHDNFPVVAKKTNAIN